jgi:hypothetical protein
MNNRATFLNREIIFGTYFIGQWIEVSESNDVQEAFNCIGKNPFKNIPLFIQTAINTTAEINGLDKVSLFDVINEIDNVGGVASESVTNLLNVFTNSILVGKEKVEGKSHQTKQKK